jgi:hypothetical protein
MAATRKNVAHEQFGHVPEELLNTTPLCDFFEKKGKKILG